MVNDSAITKAEEVVKSITEAALAVRSEMGTRLLDEIYEQCLFIEFKNRGLKFKTHVTMPVTYEGITVDDGYIIDILVEDSVIVKVKPVGSKPSLYLAHIANYLRHSGYQLGVLLDFDAKLKKKCVNRVVYSIAGPQGS